LSTGCSDRQNTWEPVGNLQGALVLKLVEFFDEQYPRADQRAKPIYMKGGVLGMRREIERRAEQARDERAAEDRECLTCVTMDWKRLMLMMLPFLLNWDKRNKKCMMAMTFRNCLENSLTFGQVLHLSQRLLNENWSTVYQRY